VAQTARIADGWLPVMIPLQRLGKEVAAFRQLVREAGRDPHSVVVRAPGSVTVTSNVEQARQESKTHLAFYITNMGDFYRAQLMRLGYEEAVQAVRQAWDRGGRAAGTAAVPDALVDSLHFAGPLDACLERLVAQEEAGIDLHAVHVDVSEPKEAAKVLERLVGA
jgi:alkanesulfonate monooxygenase SsuD/methylene tetrahydromethanopterin reductase-like flavin-dependent oxidoreductase (luciferase family)